MARKPTRSKNNPSLIAVAFKAEWWISAIISAGIFVFTFFVFPTIGSRNIFIHAFSAGLTPFLVFAGFAFALIALFNYFRQRKSLRSYRAEKYAEILSKPFPGSQKGFISVPPAQNNPVPSPHEHQVVYGWSKDDSQWGKLGVESNPMETPKRPASWSLELLQQIEWKLFEDLSAAFYREKGIRAELTKLGADGGIDIKLFQDDSGNPTSLVQCKAWNSKLVGVKPIREFLGVMTHEKIAKGFYMCSGSYSKEAEEVAHANGITLIDGKMILAMIQRLSADAQQRLLDLVTTGDYTTPSCPQCGIKMLRRSGKKGDFWGCKNFPRCRQMLHIKGKQNAV